LTGGILLMARAGVLIVLFLGLFSSLYGQNNSDIKSLLDSASRIQYFDFDETEQLVKQAEELIHLRGKHNHGHDLIRCFKIRIQSCIAFSRFRLWRQYMDETARLLIQNKQALGEEYSKLWLDNELSQAQYYTGISDYGKARELFIHLLNEFKKLPVSPENCSSLMTICNYLATIHFRHGEFEAAINQYMAAIPYSECYKSSISGPASYYPLAYRDIGRTYTAKKDYAQAGKYLQLAEDSLRNLLRERPLNFSRIALSLYEAQASYYTEIGDPGNALASIQKATPLLTLPNIDNEFKGRIHFSLGELYFAEGKLMEARHYYNRAESYFLKAPHDKAAYLAKLYLARSTLLEKTGNIDEAMEYCQLAAQKVVSNFNPDADGNPSLERIISKKHLFTALQKKSVLLEQLFRRKGTLPDLEKAFRTNRLALALLDSTANEFSLDRDKIILREQSFSAFESSIRMAYELYRQTGDEQYLDDCFTLMDKSKGVLLLENLRLVNRFSGVRPEWLERERTYKSEMLLLEQSLYRAELNKKNPGELNAVRERYASVKNDYARLMENFKKESPDYYRLRFDRTVITPEMVQRQLLKPGEALVEFFVGDSSVMILGITPKKKFVTLKKFPHGFQSAVGNLQASYFRPKGASNDLQVVVETLRSGLMSVEGEISPGGLDSLSRYVYNYLLEDCLSALGSDIRSLIIVPDGVLGYLPFESLGLLKRMAVRYAPSSSYLFELSKKRTSEAKHFFAGFVAEKSGRNYAQLPGARKEVDAITALLKADFSIFDPADKQRFLEQASDFRILHLAMHSVLNDHNPMMSEMVFSPLANADESEALLTAIELYNLKLHADLVVLSACETGIGQMHRGEGIMSFSRAFAYAGASSAVISLWKVPDKATSLLMVNFYKHLKEGLAKDEALRQAKLDFIRDYPQMAHPFYWAGFILTGSNDPLDFPKSTTWWWYVAGMLIAMMLFLAAKKARIVKRTS
jgi:tetratricopeptide (TPR) repeat protein